MVDENNTGTNLIWAITILLIVVIIAGAFYFVALDSKKPTETDIEIKVPTSSR